MADEKPFYASERLSCMLTGMFIQDNMNDIESMLKDIQEWPLGSQSELNLRLPIERRFETLGAALKSKEGVCQIPVSLKAEIERAGELFDSTDYHGAQNLLQTVQGSYQHLAENRLGKNSE